VMNPKEPIVIKGEITTAKSDTDGLLKIEFPNIDQKYYIDIHPIEEKNDL